MNLLSESIVQNCSDSVKVDANDQSSTITIDVERVFYLQDIPNLKQLIQSSGKIFESMRYFQLSYEWLVTIYISYCVDMTKQVMALRAFRRLLSTEKNPPVQECVDCGVIPIFVAMLQVRSIYFYLHAMISNTNINFASYSDVIAMSYNSKLPGLSPT